jgi:hypothetical protein
MSYLLWLLTMMRSFGIRRQDRRYPGRTIATRTESIQFYLKRTRDNKSIKDKKYKKVIFSLSGNYSTTYLNLLYGWEARRGVFSCAHLCHGTRRIPRTSPCLYFGSTCTQSLLSTWNMGLLKSSPAIQNRRTSRNEYLNDNPPYLCICVFLFYFYVRHLS